MITGAARWGRPIICVGKWSVPTCHFANTRPAVTQKCARIHFTLNRRTRTVRASESLVLYDVQECLLVSDRRDRCFHHFLSNSSRSGAAGKTAYCVHSCRGGEDLD